MTDTARSHRRPPSARLIRFAVSLAIIVIAVPYGVPASAASPSAESPTLASALRDRIVPIAGDSRLLVFGTKPSGSRVSSNPPGGHMLLHVLTKSGHRQALGETAPGFDTKVAVVGPIVEVLDAADRGLRWWNVASGQHGSVSLDRDEVYLGASPTGFVYGQQAGDAHLIEQTFSGHTTDLGDPLDPDQIYEVVTGTTGLVAAQSDDDVGNRQVAYMRWSHPGSFRQLHKLPYNGAFCDSLGAAYASCTDTLIPLRGGKPTVPPKPTACVGYSVVFRGSAVWMCAGGRLHQLTANGHLHVARRRYAPQGVVAALGRLFVSSKHQSKILTLTSLNAKPRVELTAP